MGKAALVTGASGAVGQAVAVQLAGAGWNVTLVGRDRERLRASEQVVGGSATAVVADVATEAEIDAAFRESVRTWGSLDCVVNSAAVGYHAPVDTGTSAEWREMLLTNVLGVAHSMRAALRHFPEDGGDIINIGSTSDHRVPPDGGMYAATKFAVRALTEAMRQELARHESRTRVSLISPGRLDSPAWADRWGVADSERTPQLSPIRVAEVVAQILLTPRDVRLDNVILRPTAQVR
jgi:NADP-dependent 3-hydroxy acid dehydrogenase YdfG